MNTHNYLFKEVIPSYIVEMAKNNMKWENPFMTCKHLKLMPYFVSSRSLIDFTDYKKGYPKS